MPWSTPIKVRGKRRGGDSLASSGPVAKRPKQETRLSHSSNDNNINSKRKKKATTTLLDLPLFILEDIFLRSENLEFPRCNPPIGRLLSRRSTFVKLVIQAFSPTWQQWFGFNLSSIVSYYGFERDYERIAGNVALQGAIVAIQRRDADTLTLILEAQSRWWKTEGRDRRVEPSFFDMGSPSPAQAPGKVMPAEECFLQSWKVFNTWACFGHLLSLDVDFVVRDQSLWIPKTNPMSRIEAHPFVSIPDRLLTGPHTWDSAKFLYWLIRAGGTLSDAQPERELILEGLEEVQKLEEGRLRVVIFKLYELLGYKVTRLQAEISKLRDFIINEDIG